jgi:hypothetical protein
VSFPRYRPTAAPETTTAIQAARDLMCRELLESMYLPSALFTQAKNSMINTFFTSTTFPQGSPHVFRFTEKTAKKLEKWPRIAVTVRGQRFASVP